MSIAAKLAEVYARVPRIACKGLCFEACGPVGAHQVEIDRVERKAGKEFTFSAEDGRCSMLDANNRCSVYRERPLVCRLWGVTEDMPCIYGCEPEKRLTKIEGHMLMLRIVDIFGPDVRPNYPDDWDKHYRLHRYALKRTLTYGPVHVAWPEKK